MFWQRPIKFSELVSRVYPKGVNPNLVSHFGDGRLNQITALEIEDYKAKRLLSVSSASVNRELGAIKHCFSQAIVWGLTDKNPAQGVRMLKETPRTRYLSYAEEEKILSACPIWLKEIILIALNTGMRSGEILSLLWADIDFPNQTILVRQSKNNSPRVIPMNETVYHSVHR